MDGFPVKLVNVIKAYYNDANYLVIVYYSDMASFKIRTGVRQGCIILPTLFNLVIDWIMRSVASVPLRVTKEQSVDYLDYADDIASMLRLKNY